MPYPPSTRKFDENPVIGIWSGRAQSGVGHGTPVYNTVVQCMQVCSGQCGMNNLSLYTVVKLKRLVGDTLCVPCQCLFGLCSLRFSKRCLQTMKYRIRCIKQKKATNKIQYMKPFSENINLLRPTQFAEVENMHS